MDIIRYQQGYSFGNWTCNSFGKYRNWFKIIITATSVKDNTKFSSLEITVVKQPIYNVDGVVSFYSVEPFSLKTGNRTKNWNGVIEYCIVNSEDDSKWQLWNGTDVINAGKNNSNPDNDKYYIFLRGNGNNVIVIAGSLDKRFCLENSNTLNGIVVDGNMMNLMDYNKDYANKNNLVLTNNSNSCFRFLFANNKAFKTLGENFELPAISLLEGCYYGMFFECQFIESLPANFTLPATILAQFCYYNMFRYCKSLESLPKDFRLPAMDLTVCCYDSMFKDCSSLVSLPEGFAFPAKSLTDHCYNYMFANCSSLKTLPASLVLNLNSVSECSLQGMFNSCSSLYFAKLVESNSNYRTFLNLKSLSNYCSSAFLDIFSKTAISGGKIANGDVWYVKK